MLGVMTSADDAGVPGAAAGPDPRLLMKELATYREPSLARSLFELGSTLFPFVLVYTAMLVGLELGYYLALVLALPAGGLLLRLFLIQHDCGHGSFFRSRAASDWLGRCLGVLTFTPYECWRRAHALHHASTGNLDARGFGDIDTLTVREYRALPRWRRLAYRAYRHPLVLFGLGPAYLFILRHRLPIGLMKEGRRYWISAFGTNLAIVAVAALLASQVQLLSLVLAHLLTVLVAGSGGVALFYFQHQFEDTHWDRASDWSFHHSALHGSSHLHLPGVLRWVTANIGIHHVHHLVSRIPFYRLGEVLRDRPELTGISRLSLRSAWRSLRLTLWDEDNRRLTTFAAAR